MRHHPVRELQGSLLTVLLILGLVSTSTAGIEAVKGKRYTLTKQHGPWMVMVTTLTGSTKDQYERALKSADELVYELRQKGIPAYIYVQDAKIEKITTKNRMGQIDERIYAARRNDVGIVAGNYPNIDDKVAQQTLKYIKQFHPKVLSAAGYNGQENGPGPLNKAFLMPNPLLTPEDLQRITQQRDPLLLRLNSGVDNSLTENPGEYSLVVASFYGNSQVKPTRFASEVSKGVSLDNAGMEAWQLMQAMRKQNIEAYVYHDRFRSIVTVGAFKNAQDPQIQKLYKAFCAKQKRNPETGKDVLVSESIQIGGGNGQKPLKGWVMDPYPELIKVPRLQKTEGGLVRKATNLLPRGN